MKARRQRKFFDANHLDLIMQNCDGIYFKNEFYGGETTESYYSNEEQYMNYIEYVTLTANEAEWIYIKDEDLLCRVWYVMPDKEKPGKVQDYVVFEKDIENQKVVQVTEQQGHTTIHTKMNPRDSVSYLRNEFPELPKEYYSSDVECSYEVETENYQIISAQWFITIDGKKITLTDMKVERGGEKPEFMQKMLEDSKAYQELAEHPKNKKIVTIYYNAGTENEEAYSCTVDQSCMLQPVYRDGYDVDDTKTERITDEDGTVHLNMYVKKMD